MVKGIDQPVYNVLPGLEGMLRPIGEVERDPRNARKHDERNLGAIMHSLDKFGQHRFAVARKVDGQNPVLCIGSGMHEAAEMLGWTHLAVLVVEEDEARSMARAIVDNKSGDLAQWDFPVLADQLRELVEIDKEMVVGWEEQELNQLLNTNWEPPAQGSMQPDNKDPNAVSITFNADQWAVVRAACDAYRASVDDDDLSDAVGLTEICVAYSEDSEAESDDA